VGHHTEAFVGIDTSKLRNAVAIAEGGRGGEVRYLGEFAATEAAVRKLVAKLSAKYDKLTFCYEAGPTGYWLYRLLKSLGQECQVVAPSLRERSRMASCRASGTQTAVSSPARDSLARLTASRRFVFTRLPGFFGTSSSNAMRCSRCSSFCAMSQFMWAGPHVFLPG